MLSLIHVNKPVRKRAARYMRGVLAAWACATASLGLFGCGFTTQGSPYRELGASGQNIVLDDVRAILSNADLTTDQKRTELRNLGLTDEDLLDALLSSGA